MGLFSKKHSAPEPPAETPGQRELREAREAIVADLAGRLHDSARVEQVRALPGGDDMIAKAIRRVAGR